MSYKTLDECLGQEVANHIIIASVLLNFVSFRRGRDR